MRVAICVMFLLLATAAAQTQSRDAAADQGAPAGCSGISRASKSLKIGAGAPSPADLARFQATGEACLQQLLAKLAPSQREAGQQALRLYGDAGSELQQQMQREAVFTARRENEDEMKHAAGQTAGLFARLGEMTYRYNEFLKQVSEHLEQENKSHANSSSLVKPAAPIALPPKAEMLDCHDYRIGRFDACWPPDYD